MGTRDRWIAIAVAGALLLAAWLLYVYQARCVEARSRAESLSRASETASTYASNVGSSLELIDNLVRFVSSYDAGNGMAKAAGLVEQTKLHGALLGNVGIYDTRGVGIVVNDKGTAHVDIHDRQYFKDALAYRGGGLLIGQPIIGRANHVFSIPFARPVRRPDGTVAGVVATVIESRAFAYSYDRTTIGWRGLLELLLEPDGIVLLRYSPDGPMSGGTVNAALAERIGTTRSGSYFRVSSVDKVLRASSYRHVAGYPVVSVAAIAYDEIAAQSEGVMRGLLLRSIGASIIVLLLLAAWLQQQDVKRRLVVLHGEADAARLEALAATRAKSDFLASMSHEIRTPMNGVIGLTHLVLQTELNPKQHSYMVKIQASATSLLSIINDILDISKIEAGRIELDNVAFNFASVIGNVSNIAAIRAAEKDLKFQVSVDPTVPMNLVGDPVRLGQIILNLVSNAIKFTERGDVRVSVGTAERDESKIRLIITVSDTGIGMTEDARSRLFQPFAQADSSITRRFGGTGLGLAISKAYAEMMDGTIDVASQPGAGSIFTVAVSVKRATPAEVIPALRPTFGNLRVLIVDDDPGVRTLLTRTLGSWSMHVETAESGTAAIAAIGEATAHGMPYDLVLMDWQMPNMDGIEAAKLLRSDATSGRIPIIIMVTSYAREDVLTGAAAVGIEAVLVKPVDPSLLLEAITTAFGQNAALQQEMRIPAAPTVDLAGIRLLVAEDNDINQEIVGAFLSRAGAEAVFVENGRLAVEAALAQPQRFDAVLMDVQMPEMDGLQATREIREQLSAEQLPIIAMTAHAMEEERQRCLDAGMNDHVSKPLDPAVLIATLRKWVTTDASRAGGAPAPSLATNHTSATAPRLSACNVPAALDRLGGDEDLLRALILRFCAEFANAGTDLHRFTTRSEYEDAQRLAHNLAGVASQLEATEVAAAARALELTLRAKEYDGVAALTERVATALDGAFAAATALAT